MKVGIMGGTFDPVHLGHLIAAEQAREAAGLDEVWFMPSNVPPHKKNAPGASPEERLEMVRLAVEDHPAFRATDIELTKGGTSYTVETVELLTERHPGIDFVYIIGADMVMYLPKWYRIDDIVRRISFIGLQRAGFTLEAEGLPAHIRRSVSFAPMPEIAISSTDIRRRRRTGETIRYLVPEPVRVFIEGKKLYEA